MVDLAGQLPEQQVTLAPDAQSLATQAFQTAVAPLREGSQERLTGTLESLSQRGIQFGELGSENIQDLLQRESKAEKQLASEIGVSFGKTQLENAFAASEAAKNRQLQTDLTERGFEFQAGENVAGREFSTLEREASQEFVAGETAADRESRLAESTATREFSAEQTALGREFTSEESQLQRDFGLTTQEMAQTFQSQENELGRTFTGEETQRQRDFGLSTQEAAQTFQSEENLLDRTFNANEQATELEFRTAFQEAGFDFQKDQNAIALQAEKNRGAVALALEGNLTGDGVRELLTQEFGDGVELTTNDDLALQRVATASGLSTEEYMAMRKAIGEGQVDAVMENVSDFIDNPQKARDFQLKLAQESANAMIESAKLQAGATTEAAKATAAATNDSSMFETFGKILASQNDATKDMIDTVTGAFTGTLTGIGESLRDITQSPAEQIAATGVEVPPEADTRTTAGRVADDVGNFVKDPLGEIGRGLGSGVLITACFKEGYLNKKDMIDMLRFRPLQATEASGTKSWSGYQLFFNSRVSVMNKKRLYNNIVKYWMKHIRYKLGKGKFSLRGYLTHKALSIIGLSTYYANEIKCNQIIEYYKGRSLWSIYKPIFREVEGRV